MLPGRRFRGKRRADRQGESPFRPPSDTLDWRSQVIASGRPLLTRDFVLYKMPLDRLEVFNFKSFPGRQTL